MSKFIKSSAELGAARKLLPAKLRPSGFTEAELAAAEWARGLRETQLALCRSTNGQQRQLLRAAEICSGTETEAFVPEHEGENSNGDEEHGRMQRNGAGTDYKSHRRGQDREGQDKNQDDVEDATTREKRRKKEAKKAMKRIEKKEKKQNKHRAQDVEHLHGGEIVCALHARTESSTDAIAQMIEKAQLAASTAQELREANPHKSTGVSRTPVATGVPSDPKNPLQAAHDTRAYSGDSVSRWASSRRSSRTSRRRKRGSSSEHHWDHQPFIDRSVSPRRDRTDGPMYPTRKGTWRSRAGGVFLAPGESSEDNVDSPRASPARYLYPEEFRRRCTQSESWTSASPSPAPSRLVGPMGAARRAPSRVPAPRVGTNGGEPESPERPKRLRKRRRRPSPVYTLGAPVESSLVPVRHADAA